MMWIIVVLSLLLLLSLWVNVNAHKAIKELSQYWADNENAKWLKMLEDSGCEMVDLSKISK